MNLPTQQFQVLDRGFVQLVETMGGDSGVVDAARGGTLGTDCVMTAWTSRGDQGGRGA